MKSCPAVLLNGSLSPSTPLEVNSEISVCNGQYFLSYAWKDSQRPSGHQHWMLAPFKTASLLNSEIAPIIEDARISGVIWTMDWRQAETSFGIYNFTSLINQLNRCSVLGKKLILRMFCKTYSGSFTDPVGALPTTLAIPDYIPLNHSTYGGTAFRGGIYPVYLSGTAVGWGPMLENDAVRSRWRLMVEAIKSAVGNHPAFAGFIGPDESARSAWTGSALPVGMTSSSVIAANKDMWSHAAAHFGYDKTWPVVNYIDGTESTSINIQNVIDTQSWVSASGMNVALSDTYLVPSKVTQFLQPVYYSTPRKDMSPGRKTLVHIDLLSLGAVDAGLNQRMIDLAKQTYRLGADITAWNPYTVGGGGSASYWTAMQAAIDATQT